MAAGVLLGAMIMWFSVGGGDDLENLQVAADLGGFRVLEALSAKGDAPAPHALPVRSRAGRGVARDLLAAVRRPPRAAHSAAGFEYASRMNFDVSQNIETDPVIAEKFANWRKLWEAHGHQGPKPRAFLARHVHVAETDEQARAEAEEHLVIPREQDPEFTEVGRATIARAGFSEGAGGRDVAGADPPTRLRLPRGFRGNGRG